MAVHDKLVPVQSVTPAQELERSSILDIVSYDLVLDLAGGTDTFSSRAEVRFRCRRTGAAAFADLRAVTVGRAVLNGADLDLTRTYQPGRLGLPRLADENTLVVEAEFGYTSEGAGLHHLAGRTTAPAFTAWATPAVHLASIVASTRWTCAHRSRFR